MTSVREENASAAISKLRDLIVGRCNKCDDGFIREDAEKPSSLNDFIYNTSVPCECYEKYRQHASYLISNIQKEFWGMKDTKINIDEQSKKKMSIYLKKIEGAYERGIGILFLGSEEGLRVPNNGVGKTACASKILLHAMDLRKTIHSMTMHSYFNLIYRSKQNPELLPLIHEIENVDFLLIDEVGKTTETRYVVTKFEDMIRDRSSKLMVTILITNMNKRELTDSLGVSVMDILKNTMIEISIKGSKSYRKERFLELKKEVDNDL